MENQSKQIPLPIISAIFGLLSFILLFFPKAYIATLIFAIFSVASGIWSYFTTRSWFSILGIILGGFPLIFFLEMKLISIYLKERNDFMEELIKDIF